VGGSWCLFQFFFFFFFERGGARYYYFEFEFQTFAATPPAFKAPDASTAMLGVVIIAVASISKRNLSTESIGFPVVGTVSPTMVRLGSRSRAPAIPGHANPIKSLSLTFIFHFPPHFYFSLFSFPFCSSRPPPVRPTLSQNAS
jgi:hypothetical protein